MQDGLAALKILFRVQIIAGFLILFILYKIDPGIGRIDVPWLMVVLGAGVVGIAGAHWSTRRPLALESNESLASSYRTAFFSGFGLSEMPLMLAFVACFITKDLWPYLSELPLWLIGMSLIAPTNSNLAKRQQEIAAQGSILDLAEALRAQNAKA
ncbi:MAG TPA: hypothetical protein VNP73_02680 [Actinomycetota bacterium]|nr:hypothetical protein [Actinomycetota bacterium]